MDLFRKTPATAEFLSSQYMEDEMIASVIVRRNYRMADQELILEPEQAWSIAEPPTAEEYGAFDPETPFAREGTDLFVLGRVYSNADGGTRGRFELEVDGEPKLAVQAFGERRWKRQRKALVASPPKPFESVPLTWSEAFGGKAQTFAGELPYQANEMGMGFYETERQAEGAPLAALEDPEQPVTQWSDRPRPIATSPLPRTSALRMLVGIVQGEQPDAQESASLAGRPRPDMGTPRVRSITQAYFNNAEPRMVLRPGAKAGTRVVLHGARPGGATWGFQVPECELHTHVQLAERSYIFPSHLEVLILLPEEQRVVIGHRCTYTFPIQPMERRAVTLYAGPAPRDVPASYPIDWAALDEEERRGA